MQSILLAFSRAAAGDPAGLADARRGWGALAAEDRVVLADLGRHLAGAERPSPGLSEVLGSLAAGDLDRARRGVAGVTARERALVGPLGRHLAGAARLGPDLAAGPSREPGPDPAVGPGEAGPPDAETAAWLAAHEGLDGEEDPYAGYDFAGALAQEAAREARPRETGIRSERTPEELLALMGLAAFRPSQREAVQAALDGRDSLVVMPTGGGKSLCYQLPALASAALTVVVSPLIALIGDQHRRLVDAGHRSVMLASNLGPDQNRAALEAIRSGDAQIVFCAPERFASRALRAALLTRDIALFVVDEAHCVSEWGHDFRPDYLRLRPVIELLGRPPVMAATATATPRVAQEISSRLGLRDPLLVRRGFDRPNISFDVIRLAGDGAVARKRGILLAGLAEAENRPAIVYCGTRKDTEAVAGLLCGEGIRAAPYHAGMEAGARNASQASFMDGSVEVVVATNAFGQGIDKKDIRSVWHWALPASVEGYYQEAGRAGRDGAPARAVLLAMRGDLGRLIQFIKNSEMSVADVQVVVERLRCGATDGVAIVDPRTQDDRERVALAVAERAGTVSLAPAPGGRLAATITGRLDEYAARSVCREATNRRWTAYQALKRFADSEDVCRRRQLLDHFGDDAPTAPDGRCCDVCSPIEWIDLHATRASGRARAGGRAAGGPAAPGHRSGEGPSEPPVDEEELEALKRWRLGRAEGKPAYIVAANATLEEVLRRRPRSAAELLDIRGIGPTFLERHGADLLAVLATL